MVLDSFFYGAGSLITPAVIAGAAGLAKEATDVSKGALKAAVYAGRTSISRGEKAVAAKDSDGTQRESALVDFVGQQVAALRNAGFQAEESFGKAAGTFTHQRLNSAEMQAIEERNLGAEAAMGALIDRELLVGWMNLLGGKDAIGAADLDDLDNAGTLGLEIASTNGKPEEIARARANGLGPALRKQLKGAAVGHWLSSNGPRNGISLVIKSRRNAYFLSKEDHDALLTMGAFGDPNAVHYAATCYRREKAWWTDVSPSLGDRYKEQFREIPEDAAALGSINFGVGLRPDGSIQYISDRGGAWISDKASGYEAGRIFLTKLHSFEWLIEKIRSLPLPNVE